MNEGHLGKFTVGGERAATDNHPAIIQHLPLDSSVTAALEVGTLLKAVPQDDATTMAYAPLTSAEDTEEPCAVVDKPCDPSTEASAASLVHGTVRSRVLKNGDGSAATQAQLVTLSKHGVFAG